MKRASIQPKDIDQAGKPLKRSASTSTLPFKSNIKRPRTSTKGQETASPEIEMKSEREQQGGSTGGTPAPDALQGRPKRKTAQIDYRNLNNSIATPTHQWLELIANPEKYGRTILDGQYIIFTDQASADQSMYSQLPCYSWKTFDARLAGVTTFTGATFFCFA